MCDNGALDCALETTKQDEVVLEFEALAEDNILTIGLRNIRSSRRLA
jgi:hypothetical protein